MIVTQALRDKNPQAYQEMERNGELQEFVRSLGQQAQRTYQAIAGPTSDENQKASAREVVIQEIVDEIAPPPLPTNQEIDLEF